MTTISILPENPGGPATAYRAIAGSVESVGRTAGEALDGVMAQLDATARGTLAVVQQLQPDEFFTAQQQQRLGELMDLWRQARDAGGSFPLELQSELTTLVDAEVQAAGTRAAALLGRARS